MRDDAVLINTCRGGVSTNTLKQRLMEGGWQLHGIDAFAVEPPTDDELLNEFCVRRTLA